MKKIKNRPMWPGLVLQMEAQAKRIKDAGEWAFVHAYASNGLEQGTYLSTKFKTS